MHKSRSIAGTVFLALATCALAEDRPSSQPMLQTFEGLLAVEGRNLGYWKDRLKSTDASVRERAISALPLFGTAADTDEVVGLLLGCCRDTDVSVRLRALQVLNAMTIKSRHAPDVLKELVNKLTDANSPIRFTAALGLARMGPEARPAIEALAKKAEDPIAWEIRRACLMALIAAGRSINAPPDPRAVEALLKATTDPTVEVRLEGAIGLGVLGKAGDAALASKVDKALKDLQAKDKEDPRVGVWARFSELALGEPKEAEILALTEHLNSPKVAVRSNALRALGAMGPKAKAAQSTVIKALNDKDPTVQVAAACTLAAMEDRSEGVLGALKELAERKDALEAVRQTAQAAQDLLLKKEQQGIRAALPQTQMPPLKELEGKDLDTWLGEVESRDASVRERAISALPLFGPTIVGSQIQSRVVRLLCAEMGHMREGSKTDYEDASPRLRAIQVLNVIPLKDVAEVKKVLEELTHRLSDPQALIKYEAILGINHFAEHVKELRTDLAAKTVTELCKLARDQTSWEIRRAALATLIRAGRSKDGHPHKDAVWAMAVRFTGTSPREYCSEVKLEAAIGLGALGRTTDAGAKRAVEEALKQAINDKDVRISIWGKLAFMALLDKHNDETAKWIVQQIRDKDVQIRVNAVRALAAMGPQGKIGQDRVIDALNDREPIVQLAAMGALVAMKDRGVNVLKPLKELSEAKDMPEGIRQAAKIAHDQLRTGRIN